MMITQLRINHGNYLRRCFAGLCSLLMFLLFMNTAMAQNLITGGTSIGAEIKEVSKERLTITELTNGNTVKLKYLTLNGKDNKIVIDVPAISAEMYLDAGSGRLTADMKVVKVGVASEGEGKRHYVLIEGELLGMGCRLELDYTPGMVAITGSAALDPENIPPTPSKLILNKQGKEVVFLDTHREVALLENLEPKPMVDWAKFFSLPKYLRTRPLKQNGDLRPRNAGVSRSSETSTQNSITDSKAVMTAAYEPITKQDATAVVKKYGSIPGGVTLEGNGEGIAGITSARFQASDNVIVLNEHIFYEIPVMAKEMKDILLAIATDGRIGVSLVSGYTTYGALPKDGNILLMLRQTDWFLAHLAYGWEGEYRDYRIAKNAKLKKRDDALGNIMCYFRFCDYKFAIQGSRCELEFSRFALTLIPIKVGERADDGGGLPDFEAIEKHDYPKNLLYNIRHIAKNANYYMRERMMRMVNCYGEAAAFARALKRNGIDLKKLAVSM